MSGKFKQIVRATAPPVLFDIRRRLKPQKSEWSPEQAALKSRHDALNRGLPPDGIAIRENTQFKLHPEARAGFEHFCFISPAMVQEMDAFISASANCRRLLDVGALHGIFSLVFTATHAEAEAVAVDASPIAFARLLYNAHANPGLSIKPVECALSDDTGVLAMHYEWEHTVAGNTAPPDLTVPMRTGDDLCDTLGFAPDTIKIDVEGHELHVLRGLHRTIARERPLIFLELHPLRINSHGASAADVASEITAHGYRAETTAGIETKVSSLGEATEDMRIVLRPA